MKFKNLILEQFTEMIENTLNAHIDRMLKKIERVDYNNKELLKEILKSLSYDIKELMNFIKEKLPSDGKTVHKIPNILGGLQGAIHLVDVASKEEFLNYIDKVKIEFENLKKKLKDIKNEIPKRPSKKIRDFKHHQLKYTSESYNI